MRRTLLIACEPNRRPTSPGEKRKESYGRASRSRDRSAEAHARQGGHPDAEAAWQVSSGTFAVAHMVTMTWRGSFVEW